MSRSGLAVTTYQGNREIRSQGKGWQREVFLTARVARPRNASVLAYSQRNGILSLESCVLGNGPAQFGKGATEKVREEPRRCPTSFGGEGLVFLSNQDPASYPTLSVNTDRPVRSI